MATSTRSIAFAFCLCQAVCGCDESQEAQPDHVEFVLPAEMLFEFKTPDQPGTPGRLVVAALDSYLPNMVCAGSQALASDCCAPPSPYFQAVDCVSNHIVCDTRSNYCALALELNVTRNIDLAKDVPALSAVRGRVFSRIELTALSTSFERTSAQPDVPSALPITSADLYLGPRDLERPSSAGATHWFGVSTTPGTTDVRLSQAVRQAFASTARDYLGPFSIMLSLRVVLGSPTKVKIDEWRDAVDPRRTAESLGESLTFTVAGQATAYY